VLISNSALAESVRAGWVDRVPKHDGVVYYDDITIVVENKPSLEDVWPDQLSLGRESVAGSLEDYRLYPTAVSITWPDVLEQMLRLGDSDLVSYPGRQVIYDVLDLVVERYPDLSPYRTFGLCNDRPEALRKRVDELVDAIAKVTSSEVASHPGTERFISRPGAIAQELQLRVMPLDSGWLLR